MRSEPTTPPAADRADATDLGPRICFCMKVHLAAIVMAIRAGATTVDELRAATRASAGCGTCRPDLEAILHTWFRGQPPVAAARRTEPS